MADYAPLVTCGTEARVVFGKLLPVSTYPDNSIITVGLRQHDVVYCAYTQTYQQLFSRKLTYYRQLFIGEIAVALDYDFTTVCGVGNLQKSLTTVVGTDQGIVVVKHQRKLWNMFATMKLQVGFDHNLKHLATDCMEDILLVDNENVCMILKVRLLEKHSQQCDIVCRVEVNMEVLAVLYTATAIMMLCRADNGYELRAYSLDLSVLQWSRGATISIKPSSWSMAVTREGYIMVLMDRKTLAVHDSTGTMLQYVHTKGTYRVFSVLDEGAWMTGELGVCQMEYM